MRTGGSASPTPTRRSCSAIERRTCKDSSSKCWYPSDSGGGIPPTASASWARRGSGRWDRYRILAEASALLAGSLHYEETLERVAGLVVPILADGCVIHVVDGARLQQLAAAHTDPARRAALVEGGARAPSPEERRELWEAMRSRNPGWSPALRRIGSPGWSFPSWPASGPWVLSPRWDRAPAPSPKWTWGSWKRSRSGPRSGDSDRLQQVVWNLLSNAIKFTPRGGHVQASVHRGDGADGRVELRVEDTGMGIRADFLPHVFDRFRQGDSSITRAHGGLGLGLALVRHLVELHGGTVQAASAGERPGGGRRDRRPRAGGGRPRAPRGPGDPAANASEALKAIEGSAPHVLLCDIEMPGEDGYELMRRLRARPEAMGGSTPAAALTAYARTEDRLRALQAGFQMHLPKPVQPGELAAVVARLAGRPV